MGRAGQGRRVVCRSWGTELGTDSVLPSFFSSEILALQRQPLEDRPLPRSEDRSLSSQNMANMGQ